MISKFRFAALATAVGALAVAANAVNLVPGGSVATPGELSNLGALVNFQSTNFTGLDSFGNTVFTGEMYNWVYTDPSGGGLVFWYQLHNDASSTDPIAAASYSRFGGFTTSVDWITDSTDLSGGTLVGSTTADRSGGAGNVIAFHYSNGGFGDVEPGMTAASTFIATNAQAYDDRGSLSMIDGGIATVQAFEPTAVPEPASVAILGLGVLGLIRRRKA